MLYVNKSYTKQTQWCPERTIYFGIKQERSFLERNMNDTVNCWTTKETKNKNNQIFRNWFVIIHHHLRKVSAQILQCIIFEHNELSITLSTQWYHTILINLKKIQTCSNKCPKIVKNYHYYTLDKNCIAFQLKSQQNYIFSTLIFSDSCRNLKQIPCLLYMKYFITQKLVHKQTSCNTVHTLLTSSLT